MGMTLELLVSAVKKSGLRITPAKKNLLQLFLSAATPITALDILRQMDINKTSVYRAIDSLLETGIICEVDFGDSIKRYELTRKDHHHHLICLRCKSVTEYPVSDQLEQIENQISRKTKFTVQRHTLEFFGVCRTCQL